MRWDLEMYNAGVAVGLLLVCMLVAAGVGSLQVRLAYRQTPEELRFMVLSSASGVASVATSVLYLAYLWAPSPFTLALGDATMTAAPALLWAAFGRLAGRRRSVVVFAASASVTVGAVSLLVPQPESTAVKILALLTSCALIAAAARPQVHTRRWGASLVIAAVVAYAVYCVGRLVAGSGLGWDSSVYLRYFSIGPTTLVSGIVVVIVAIGAGRIATAIRRPKSLPAPSIDRAIPATVTITDYDLIRHALGYPTAEELTRALSDIIGDVAHIVEVKRDRMVMMVPIERLDIVTTRIRDRYAAAADEITQLTVNELKFD